MSAKPIALVDPVEVDEKQTKQRRVFMYSSGALKAAEVVDAMLVNYVHFNDALEAMDRAFQLAGVLSTPQGVLVAGHRGMGRTSLAAFFLKQLPRPSPFDSSLAALQVSLSKFPTAASIIEPLLLAVGYHQTHVTLTRLDRKRQILEDALRQRRTKMLIVDNAEYLITQRGLSRSDKIGTCSTAMLRSLMDGAGVALVLLGDISLEQLNKVDDALADRIGATVRLERLAAANLWKKFVELFVKGCRGIDVAILAIEEETVRAQRITGGSLRAFKHLALEAVLVAYDDGASAVRTEHLRLAYARAFRGSREVNPYAAA